MEHSPLDFDDLQAFFLVVESGSFARAAHRLDSSKSIVSRRVARLEEGLGALLLQRTARGTHLTEVGQAYYDAARAAMQQLECAAENLSEAVTDISGRIRLTGPVLFGSQYLAPVLAEFCVLYPKIELEVDFSDAKIDIANEGYDVAVRLGQLPDSALVQRLLCQSRRMVVASPAYLSSHSPITRPEDIEDHAVVHYSGVNTQEIWRYSAGTDSRALHIRPRFRSNSAAMLLAAAKAGLGLTLLPVYVTGAALQTRELETVLNGQDWGCTPVTLLLPQGRAINRRVRALVDFLVLRFTDRFV